MVVRCQQIRVEFRPLSSLRLITVYFLVRKVQSKYKHEKKFVCVNRDSCRWFNNLCSIYNTLMILLANDVYIQFQIYAMQHMMKYAAVCSYRTHMIHAVPTTSVVATKPQGCISDDDTF